MPVSPSRKRSRRKTWAAFDMANGITRFRFGPFGPSTTWKHRLFCIECDNTVVEAFSRVMRQKKRKIDKRDVETVKAWATAQALKGSTRVIDHLRAALDARGIR